MLADILGYMCAKVPKIRLKTAIKWRVFPYLNVIISFFSNFVAKYTSCKKKIFSNRISANSKMLLHSPISTTSRQNKSRRGSRRACYGKSFIHKAW